MTPLDHVAHLGKILDDLGVRWVLGGSLASSFAGEPRSTVDIDLAVELDVRSLDGFVAAVQDDYYISTAMASDAIERSSSFNLLHYASGEKVDVFALGDDLLDRRQIERRVQVGVDVGDGRLVRLWVGAPDDQVLRKLSWFRAGGHVSERQWRDVVSILRVQGTRIDRDELRLVATQLHLDDLVERAIAESDLI